MVRPTCENWSPFVGMASFRCVRLLARFLTIQVNPGQFCSITISSVSLCYWVHYFSVAFEKMTSLRKYTRGSVQLFCCCWRNSDETLMPTECLLVNTLIWDLSGCSSQWICVCGWILAAVFLASLSSWRRLWCMCDMNARTWSEKKNLARASDKSFAVSSFGCNLCLPLQILS